MNNINKLNPIFFLPYAGFFNESAQRDKHILKNNKNTILPLLKLLWQNDKPLVEKYEQLIYQRNF